MFETPNQKGDMNGIWMGDINYNQLDMIFGFGVLVQQTTMLGIEWGYNMI
jgi:hypothetical protein